MGAGVEVVRDLAECLLAIGNARRLSIALYCLTPQRFRDITLDLRLNPASFRFHVGVLMECALVRKTKRGIYETTELGKLILKLVEEADRIQNA